MKRVLLAAAAFVAAVAVLTVVSLPPKPIALTPVPDGSVRGVLHVHTNRSDGRSSPEDVAAAAERAGLKFVVFTDHGDGTRPPDPPAYVHGVLAIDAVEISTTGGHYIALGLPAAPYPLGGDPRDVVDDVKRLGGFGYAAHPDSPKDELRWTNWSLPIDGLEISNLDTSWRVRATAPNWGPTLRLFQGVLTYPFRPGETIARLLTDVSGNVARWDVLAAKQPTVGLAGADAHGKILSLPLPSYEASFLAQSVYVDLDGGLSGNAADDSARLLEAIRHGNLHFTVDALASPPSFAFTAETLAVAPSERHVHEGDRIFPGGPVTLRVKSNAPSSFVTTLWRGSEVLRTGHEREMSVTVAGDPANYRVDIRAADRPGHSEWLISNPIYLAAEPAPEAPAPAPPADTVLLYDGGLALGWRPENVAGAIVHLDLSTNPLNPAEGALRLQYALSDDFKSTATFLADTRSAIIGSDRVTFRGHADRPVRLSVQLRTSIGGGPEERWSRSVYLDTTDRSVTVPFADMTPLGSTSTPFPDLAHIGNVLFVIDTNHTKPGSKGEIWIERAALQHATATTATQATH